MALNALTLAVTQGVVGRPFVSAVNGLTYPTRVEVLVDGSPGGSYVNGAVFFSSLPYPTSTIVLREYEPGVGAGYRDSRIDITAATVDSLRTQALASLSGGRSLVRWRVGSTRQSDGSYAYSLFVEDDLGATVPQAIGGAPTPTPTPAPTITQPSISPGSGTAGTTIFTGTDGTPTDGTITAREWLIGGVVVATGGVFAPTSAQTGSLTYRNTVTGAGGTASNTSAAVTIAAAAPALAAFTTAKYNGDSRTANGGTRSFTGGSVSVSTGMTGFNQAALIQALCGNKWLIDEGYNHAVGGSTTQAHLERDKTASIATTGNPARARVNGPSFDDILSQSSDGIATTLNQAGSHVVTCSLSVNDGSGTQAAYYNSPSLAGGTIATIASIADAYGAAGKVWYVGDEFVRGGTYYTMEAKTPDAGGAFTATNTTQFIDGESFGVVGAIGVYASGLPKPLTKVASAPAQDQYTVNAAGNYVVGGATKPTTVYINYNANSTSNITSDHTRIVNEWMNSSAANFVSAINGVNYGLPGLLYNRPWVRLASTYAATQRTAGSLLPKAGYYDTLQLHGTHIMALDVAAAFKAKVDADYPSAPVLDTAPTRNNWFADRGLGSGVNYGGTLPPTMRSAFTGGPVPTIVSISGAVVGRVNTSSGAITGPNIVSGSLNFTTGVWSLTLTAATVAPVNAPIWFEQDIGNYDAANLAEGTIGRNPVMNGLLDMTAAVGNNLTTTTGISAVTGITNAQIPYGWTLNGTAMSTAITNGTASVSVGSETDADGFPRFWMEAQGSHTAATSLQLIQSFNVSQLLRFSPGDKVLPGGALRYAKHSTLGRAYGCQGATLLGQLQYAARTVNTATATAGSTGSATISLSRVQDQVAGMYVDDAVIDRVAALKGDAQLYRIAPRFDTTGTASISGGQAYAQFNAPANLPFALRVGFGRIQVRRRNDVVWGTSS